MSSPGSATADAARDDRYRTRLLVVAAICAVAGVAAFAIDLPVARWCRQEPPPLPGDLLKFLDLAEAFAHGLGVAALVMTLLAADPHFALPLPGRPPGARRNFLRFVTVAVVGGLVVGLFKACFERTRPFAADLAALGSVFDTFGTPHFSLRRAARLMSFPSGHAAAAAGLAAALGWMYPHGRIAFAVLAAASAAQRVVASAHYPSDVCFGAAIGLAAAAAFVGGRPPWRRTVAVAADT